MLNKIRFFIPLAVAITGICGLVYLTVQQNYRQNANDPQIQMSEDSASYLKQLEKWDPYPKETKINITESLSPFMILYEDTGKVFASTGEVDGKTPELPKGVLDYTKVYKQDRLTWEPKEGVRIAAVVTRFEGKSSGYVLAGRNMREVEKREERLEQHVFLAWIVTMVATFVATLLFTPPPRKK